MKRLITLIPIFLGLILFGCSGGGGGNDGSDDTTVTTDSIILNG